MSCTLKEGQQYLSWAPTQVEKWRGGGGGNFTPLTKDFMKSSIFAEKEAQLVFCAILCAC